MHLRIKWKQRCSGKELSKMCARLDHFHKLRLLKMILLMPNNISSTNDVC